MTFSSGAAGSRPAARRAVLFDFGGVFVPSPFEAVRTAADHLEIDPRVFASALFGPYGEDLDHPWHRLERGELSLVTAMGEIEQTMAARLGQSLSLTEVFGSFLSGAMTVRAWMVDVAARIHAAGIATAVVTNNIAEFGDTWKRLVPLHLFDELVDSSAVGVRKPNPAIYEIALDRLRVEAAHALFVDDLASNVAAAEALGITGVVVPQEEAAAHQAATLILEWAGLD